MLTKCQLRICLSIITLTACVNKSTEKIQILHEGSFTVKARFVGYKREGLTEVYDSSNKLTGILHYENDALSGVCIHYFANGAVSDSVNYKCNKERGYWRHFYPDGSPRHINYYYFGLQFGPDLWYDKDTVLRSFKFLDFERHPLLECLYNRHGHIDSIANIALPISLTEKEKNGIPLVEFFAYLPEIPLVKQTYYIGIADSKKNIRKLCDIQGSNFFIDTMLTNPPSGYHFYLGCHLKAIEGGIDTTLITEAIKR